MFEDNYLEVMKAMRQLEQLMIENQDVLLRLKDDETEYTIHDKVSEEE